MIKKYRFYSPFQTDAVIKNIELSSELVYLQKEETDTSISFSYPLDKEDAVYGLGENVRGINKRGFTYKSQCVDDTKHLENKNSLYSAHNFLVVFGKNTFGIFVDCPGIVSFDIGDSDMDMLSIQVEGKDLDLYIIEGNSISDIVKQFREIIGQSYIPPKWGFGYQQSRWGYKNSDDFREVAFQYKKHHIPLEAIYMDIDYMEDYKNFTYDSQKFPDFDKLILEMKQQGIHLVPIIDAGVKIQDGYSVYEEGKKNNYFCKDINDNDFVGGVWPGRCHFPDFLNKDTREWFGNQYKYLLDKGIDGFWNDMNEPSIFYSEKRLGEAFQFAREMENQSIDVNTFFRLTKHFGKLSNNKEDYKLFYHHVNGKKYRHDFLHNLYGYNMTRAAGEAFERLCPDQRILMFSRSSYIGMHRYGGLWTGDNRSWWSHLLLNIQMMPSLNMCGFLYAGADIGGYCDNVTEDLLMRWIEFGMFTPLMRNHNCGQRDQELYQFKNISDFKHLIELRYAFIPYLYSEYLKCAYHNDLYFRPLVFDYPDDSITKEIEDQLMVGESIMIAPIYKQNATGRYIYLPEDMMMITFRAFDDYDQKVINKGHHYIPVQLNEVVIFIKKHHIIPLCKPADNTSKMDFHTLYILGYIEGHASYTLYDDGKTKDDYQKTEIIIHKNTIQPIDNYHLEFHK